jgi:hypothetical protein
LIFGEVSSGIIPAKRTVRNANTGCRKRLPKVGLFFSLTTFGDICCQRNQLLTETKNGCHLLETKMGSQIDRKWRENVILKG